MKKFIDSLFLIIFISFCFFACSDIEDNTIQDQVKETCKLPSGKIVEDGFSGNDNGDNYCNQCRCSNGMWECTEMYCKHN